MVSYAMASLPVSNPHPLAAQAQALEITLLAHPGLGASLATGLLDALARHQGPLDGPSGLLGFRALTQQLHLNLDPELRADLVRAWIRQAQPWAAPVGFKRPWGWSALVDVARQRALPEALEWLLEAPGAPESRALETTMVSDKGTASTPGSAWNLPGDGNKRSVLGWALAPDRRWFMMRGSDGEMEFLSKPVPWEAEATLRRDRTDALIRRLVAAGVSPNAPVTQDGRVALEHAPLGAYRTLAEVGALPQQGAQKVALGWLNRVIRPEPIHREALREENVQRLAEMLGVWQSGLWTPESAADLHPGLVKRLGLALGPDLRPNRPTLEAFWAEWEQVSGQSTASWPAAVFAQLAHAFEDHRENRKAFREQATAVLPLLPDRLDQWPSAIEWAPGADLQAGWVLFNALARPAALGGLDSFQFEAVSRTLRALPPGPLAWSGITVLDGLRPKLPGTHWADTWEAVLARARSGLLEAVDRPETEALQAEWLARPPGFARPMGRFLGELTQGPAHNPPANPAQARLFASMGLIVPACQEGALKCLAAWGAACETGVMPQDLSPWTPDVLAVLQSPLAEQVARASGDQALARLRELRLSVSLAPAAEASASRRPRL